MNFLGLILGRLLDWLLELPPDLLGRKIERILDRASGKRRRVHARSRRGRRAKRVRRGADMV